jgi:uncharacterized repeat protein (TIGR01451 family)
MFGGDAPCFGSFLAETRSSQETDAQLKDFALGDFNTCVPPDIATTSSASSVDFGGTVHDTATLSGTAGAVTGTVTFFVCTPAQIDAAQGCPTGGTQVGSPVTIVAGSATSANYTVGTTAAAAGKYCWRAVYTPDADSDYLGASHSNNSTECFTVAPATIDITKSANPAGPVSAGDEIGFDITVTNTGDGTALGVSVSDPLPAGVDWSADDPTGDTTGVDCEITGSVGSQTLSCTDASMAADDSFSVHVSGLTDAADCGTVSNTASVSTTNDGSDSATASVVVDCPDVLVEKSAEVGVILVGDTAQFSITVSNIGDGTAHDVVLTDPLPGGLDWTDDSADCTITAGTLSCNIGDLGPGDEFTVTVSANTDTEASESEDCGLLDNTASAVASNEGQDVLGNNQDSASIVVTCTSALIIEKSFTGNSGGTDPILHVPAAKIGDTLHYTLEYTGAGPLTNAVITDVIPAGLEYVAGTALGNADFNDGTYDAATRTLTWTAKGVLPDPAHGTVTYDVKVTAAAPALAQPLVNVATIDSDETEPDSDTASVAVLAPPLELTPPPTNTILPETGTSNPGFALMLVLLGIAGLAIGVGFITPAPQQVRRRDRRG